MLIEKKLMRIIERVPCTSELIFPGGLFIRRKYVLLKTTYIGYLKSRDSIVSQSFESNMPLPVFATFLWLLREMRYSREGESLQYPKRLLPYIDSLSGKRL